MFELPLTEKQRLSREFHELSNRKALCLSRIVTCAIELNVNPLDQIALRRYFDSLPILDELIRNYEEFTTKINAASQLNSSEKASIIRDLNDEIEELNYTRKVVSRLYDIKINEAHLYMTELRRRLLELSFEATDEQQD